MVMTAMENFRCAECGAEFMSRESLDEHTRRAHGSGLMPTIGDFLCEACGAEFDTQETLEEHHRQAHPSAA